MSQGETGMVSGSYVSGPPQQPRVASSGPDLAGSIEDLYKLRERVAGLLVGLRGCADTVSGPRVEPDPGAVGPEAVESECGFLGVLHGLQAEIHSQVSELNVELDRLQRAVGSR